MTQFIVLQTPCKYMLKRIFDVVLAEVLLLLLIPVLLFCVCLAWYDTCQTAGLFFQKRVGQYGRPFTIIKLRTIQKQGNISRIGNFLRRYKLDELPQLLNILVGDMSFVGPRPDISGYYDHLVGEERKILELKPGITSEAALKYRNEEQLLAAQCNPLQYNDEVIFPDKVKMNLDYYHRQNFILDLKIIGKTIALLIF